MSLQAAFDYTGADWAPVFCKRNDAYNIFGPASLSIGDLPRLPQGAGSSSFVGVGFTRYAHERARYGKTYVTWTTGTALGNIMVGYDGLTNWTIPANVLPSNTYTLVIWAKIVSGANNSFRIDAYRDSATLIANGTAAAANSSTWTKYTLTFNFTATAGDDRIYLLFQRTTGSGVSQAVNITGAMLVAGSTAPDYFNCGADSLLGVLTDDWLEDSKFGLGFIKAYQYVAPVGRADLKLSNAEQRYSPEYASGPLYGELVPNRLVQVGDPDYGIWWTGWVDSWKPEPGTNRDRYAYLSATDARRFLSNVLPTLPLYSADSAIDIINDVLGRVSLPNTTEGYGTGVNGADAWEALPTTVTTDYYADNTPNDHDIVKFMGDMFGSLQGHLWFSREGSLSVALQQGDDTPASYIDIGEDWNDIADAIAGTIINRCEAFAYKRKSQAGSFTVWEMDDVPAALAGSATEDFRAYFKNSTGDKILVAATGLAVVETNSGVAGDITAALSDIGAQSALITFTNHNLASRNITAASITATARIVQMREESKVHEDATSITANGTLGERLNFQYTQKRSWADKLAHYRVARFKDARYEIPWVELNVSANRQDAFDCHVGAAVRVTDTQTGHDDYYAVIGEQHTIRDGLTNHTVKLYLEPLYPTTVDNTAV